MVEQNGDASIRKPSISEQLFSESWPELGVPAALALSRGPASLHATFFSRFSRAEKDFSGQRWTSCSGTRRRVSPRRQTRMKEEFGGGDPSGRWQTHGRFLHLLCFENRG